MSSRTRVGEKALNSIFELEELELELFLELVLFLELEMLGRLLELLLELLLLLEACSGLQLDLVDVTICANRARHEAHRVNA
jgi:hypothetical protein